MNKKEIEKNDLLIELGWRMSFMREDLFYMQHGIDNNIPNQYKYRLKLLRSGLETLKKDLEKLKKL